ncbi:MAG: MFS transporter [Chloroflexi bacterium]|nr:MFS transporter [Chloroflexota bacterium]
MQAPIWRAAQAVRASLTPPHNDKATDAETRLYADNYRYLLLSGVWFGPVDGGIFNYLPVFLARLGATPSIVSLLTSGQSLLGIFAFIPGGAYTERHRDLMKLFVRAGLVTRLIYLLIALSPLLLDRTAIPLVAVLLWTLVALPNAIHIPAWAAIMQKAVPPGQRARLNGTRWALMSLASGTCLALFGLLLDRIPFPIGYQVVFGIGFVAGVVNILYFGKVRTPPFDFQSAQGEGNASLAARLRTFVRPFAESRPFVRFSIANLAYRLALALPAGLFSVFWVRELHATDTWIGLRGTAGYAALVVGYWLWGRVTNRIGHRNLLLLCGAGLALYPALTALAPTPAWLLPAAVIWGLTAAGVDIGLFDMLLAACPEGKMPSFAAAANVITSIASSVGPLLGAALAQGIGTRSALLVIGGLQAVAAASFLLLPNRQQEGLG